MSDKIFYTNSMKMLFTLLWILSLPKMLCYELEGINQCNWVCKCRIKAEFKLFSAQHFFENSILFIFSNKQLFLFHNISCSPILLGLVSTLFPVHSPGWSVWSGSPGQAPLSLSWLRLTLRWSHSPSPWPPRVEAAPTGPRPPDPGQGTSAISRGHEDRPHLSSRHHGKSTLNRTKNTMETSFYWAASDAKREVIIEMMALMSHVLANLGPGVLVFVKYFNTTLGTKTFLPKKVNKHKSFSVL